MGRSRPTGVLGRTLSGPAFESGPPGDLQNDLQDPVAAHHPEIARIVRALQKAGAFHAAMSGSGSAVFGLFSRRPAAERAARALSKSATAMIGPEEKSLQRILVTRTSNRTAYQRLAGDWRQRPVKWHSHGCVARSSESTP